MKKYVFLAILALFAVTARGGFGAEQEDPIMQLKLTPESLPRGVKIVREVWASTKQLLSVRMRVGFPINSLLNQSMIYDNEQAQVNYMLMPDEDWLVFGYSKLVETDGDRSTILTKDSIIIEIAATKKEFGSQLAKLFKVDPVHYVKIRTDLLPEDWKLIEERYLPANEVLDLGSKFGISLKSGVTQEFLAGHLKVEVRYYNCGTPQVALSLANLLASKEKPFFKQMVTSSGPIVVLAESQSDELNTYAMSLVNW